MSDIPLTSMHIINNPDKNFFRFYETSANVNVKEIGETFVLHNNKKSSVLSIYFVSEERPTDLSLIWTCTQFSPVHDYYTVGERFTSGTETFSVPNEKCTIWAVAAGGGVGHHNYNA